MGEEARPLGRLQLQLNPIRLAAIIDNAVVTSGEVVNFHFDALANADLSKPAQAGNARYQFRAPDFDADERRAMHERWILAKAFQELLRAVRHAVEEAHMFVA